MCMNVMMSICLFKINVIFAQTMVTESQLQKPSSYTTVAVRAPSGKLHIVSASNDKDHAVRSGVTPRLDKHQQAQPSVHQVYKQHQMLLAEISLRKLIRATYVSEVAGATFSESDSIPVTKYQNPDPDFFICENPTLLRIP